jgi:hypothetical protein
MRHIRPWNFAVVFIAAEEWVEMTIKNIGDSELLAEQNTLSNFSSSRDQSYHIDTKNNIAYESRYIHLARIRLLTILLTTVATIAQLLIFFSLSNFIMSALLLVGVWTGTIYTLRKTLLLRYPISGIMLLGYVLSYFILPPLGQLSGLHSVTHNLVHPVLVEAYAVVGLFSLICGHLIYRYGIILLGVRTFISSKIYKPLGFFSELNVSQFWVMGGFGVVATLLMYLSHSHARLGFIHGLLNGIEALIYVPYLLLVPTIWRARQARIRNRTWLWLWLTLYTLLVLVCSMMVNSRTFLLMGIASVGIVYGYLLLTGKVQAPRIRLRTLVLVVIAIIAITGPVTELAMSMVLVRGLRNNISAMKLVEKTWSVYTGGHVDMDYRMLFARLNRSKQDDELYYQNLFLNRLGNLKFVDLAIINSTHLTDAERVYFRHIEMGKVIATFPEPVLNLLGARIDKKLLISGSSGDFLIYAATGNSDVLGGFRTGSLLVVLYLICGLLWPIILALLSSIVFSLVDAFTMVTSSPSSAGRNYMVTINVLVASTLFSYMFFFTSAATGTEGVSGLALILLRGWIQIGLIYSFAYWLSRIILGDIRLRMW